MKGFQELKAKVVEMSKSFEVDARHVKQLDEAVNTAVAEAEHIRRDIQTRLEHRVIDQAEADRLRIASRQDVLSARLDRLEATIVSISKTSSQSVSIVMETLALIVEEMARP